MSDKNGGSAFPEICTDYHANDGEHGRHDTYSYGGMSLRDYFAAAALQNHVICTGTVPEWQLKVWFGDRGGITAQQIVAKQAASYADAMLAERTK